MTVTRRLAVPQGFALALGLFWVGVCVLSLYGVVWLALGGGL